MAAHLRKQLLHIHKAFGKVHHPPIALHLCATENRAFVVCAFFRLVQLNPPTTELELEYTVCR